MLDDLIKPKDSLSKPVLLGRPQIMEIGDKACIETCEYEYRKDKYYDIKLIRDNKEYFLGRIYKEEYLITPEYKDGKIIVLGKKFIKNKRSVEAVKVYSLYSILDDTFICATEKDALNLFDEKQDSSNLIDPDNLIHTTDFEKKKRL